MFSILEETHKCVQGGEIFTACILIKDGKRFFATEEKKYLLASPVTFGRGDVTIVLEWDRNSVEAPGLGPKMDHPVGSSLFVRHADGVVLFEWEEEGSRIGLFEVLFDDWCTAVEAINP